MKTAVLFYTYVSIKCDLYELNDLDCQFYLVVTPNIFEKLLANQKAFFKKIFVIDEMSISAAKPVVESLLKQNNKKDIFLLSVDESSLGVVAELRGQFNLPGATPKIVRAFLDKVVMKERLVDAKIRMPKYIAFNDKKFKKDPENYLMEIEQQLDYPMLAKPIDLCGSHSVFKINDLDNLWRWAKSIYNDSIEYEIDEFIDGVLYHCDALVKGGKVLFQSISEYCWPCAYFGRGYPLGSIIIPEESPHWEPIATMNQDVIKALNTPDGTTHLEVFIKENGEVIFLEIACRPPGALVIQSIELLKGINLEIEHYRVQLNPHYQLPDLKNDMHSFWFYLPRKEGVLKSHDLPTVQCQYEMHWMLGIGEKMHEIEEGSAEIVFRPENLVGSMIIYSHEFNDVYSDFQKIKEEGNHFLKIDKK